MGSFNPKLKKYEVKFHRGVICDGNEELHKISRGIDLSFQIDMTKLRNFDPSTRKSQKVSL